MKTSLLINLEISNFEMISEHNEGSLLGGFSTSFSVESVFDTDGSGSNNCMGANCRTDCGVDQNRNCNIVIHCGA